MERLPATLELSLCAMLVATRARHSARRVDRAAPARGLEPRADDPVARRRRAADVPHRHRADPDLLGLARLAAFLRARHHGGVRKLDDRPADRERPQGAGAAEPHARPVPDDADPAARARRDAGSAARRLHPFRARPRSHQSRRELSSRAEEHAGPGDHDHRPAVRQHLRVLDHRRNRVSVAGPRTTGHPVDPVRRCAVARRLSGDDRARLCGAEPAVDLLYAAIDPRVRTGLSPRGGAHECEFHRSAARLVGQRPRLRLPPLARRDRCDDRDDRADRYGDRGRFPRAATTSTIRRARTSSTRVFRPAPRACLAVRSCSAPIRRAATCSPR